MNAINNAQMKPVDALVKAHELVAHEVEFNSEWNNGTGYFDELAKKAGEFTQITKFTTTGGRIGIIIPKDGFNLVIFRRYTEEDRVCYHDESFSGETLYRNDRSGWDPTENGDRGYARNLAIYEALAAILSEHGITYSY